MEPSQSLIFVGTAMFIAVLLTIRPQAARPIAIVLRALADVIRSLWGR